MLKSIRLPLDPPEQARIPPRSVEPMAGCPQVDEEAGRRQNPMRAELTQPEPHSLGLRRAHICQCLV